ncbi:ribonucleotide-diphosphate reductase subunit beta [Methylobacterium ajmalii]|uniref:ribonucleotide-diphosphate reductase subunit beta n=1 Tax=Methylobacterium ajmalii TaxID=2738439 RepID=UPI002F35FDD2
MLFEEQLARKPNKYPWTQDFIQQIWNHPWFPTDFKFSADFQQFHGELNDEERGILVRAISAIGQIEIAVKTFWAKLGENLPHPALSDLGLEMSHTEVVHNIAYETVLDRLGLTAVFEENLKLPVIAGRVAYLRKYNKQVYEGDKRKQYVYALILFTLFVENVSLFSQFYVILWFNRVRRVMRDTAQQVQYTRNEELLHAQVGIKIINTLKEEYPELFDAELEARVLAETQEAFRAESAVIDWIMGGFAERGVDSAISAPILKTFVAHRLNTSLQAIGYAPVMPVDAALLADTVWMDEENYGNNKTDFFHKRPVDYAKHAKTYNLEDLLR